MQKIFSTRLEESTIDELTRVTRRLGVSKRQFLEEAIHARAKALGGTSAEDVWTETLGAWQRTESAGATVRRARESFERGFARHHRSRRARVRR
jgi:hypothetical protein